MMKNYTLLLKSLLLTCAFISSTSLAAQSWEQILQLPATQNIFVAPNGNLIASDFQFDYSGGIHYSTDKGATWTKSDVADFAYNKMIQAGDYIIAVGDGCNLARSKDNGVTWEVLNYAYMFTDFITEENLMYDVTYAITYFKEKLFVADFSGGGVIYSEDFGETWTLTDRESLKYNVGQLKSTAKDDATALDSYYNLAENNGELLLFGVYFIYRLNESDYTWELLRSDSNFMGVSTTIDDKLICGRAIMNYNEASPYLEYTTDGGRNWAYIAHADTTFDTNVRAIHSDNLGLYTGMQSGNIFYSPDLGVNWTRINEGLPTRLSPLILDSDDEYLYAAIYDLPFSSESTSGVYRFKKSELPVASLNTTLDDKQFNVSVCNNTLYTTQVADITIYNANGLQVLAVSKCNTLDITTLNSGIYIFNAVSGNKQVTGKFIR